MNANERTLELKALVRTAINKGYISYCLWSDMMDNIHKLSKYDTLVYRGFATEIAIFLWKLKVWSHMKKMLYTEYDPNTTENTTDDIQWRYLTRVFSSLCDVVLASGDGIRAEMSKKRS